MSSKFSPGKSCSAWFPTHLFKSFFTTIRKNPITEHRLLTAFFLLFFSVQTFAQFTLSGTVTDSGTQQPLPGATVLIKGTFKGVNTLENGKFELKGLKKGSYTLTISFVGYEKTMVEVNLQEDKPINVSLIKLNLIADEVVVTATRASEKSPTTFSTVSKEDLEKQNLGQDLPMLLNQTPSVVVNSDAGAGVGYTGIRIRGSDPTRVNVTVNGIPMNDAESQGTYFVDFPDLASSVQSIQIQRGVGTSTNGAGAFGATLNIQTNTLNQSPYAEINNSGGSFGTRKHTVKIGTGLIDGKWAFDGRLSRLYSDGFIDRSSSDLSSYFVSGGYYGKRNMFKINVFSGKETTYQAWNGIPESRLKGDISGMQDYISRNGLDAEDAQALLNSNSRTYNQFTYDNQTDNYKQDNYQFFYSQEVGKYWSLNAALHYTKGKGYYEEFRKNDSFSSYNLPNVVQGADTITKTDIIRRRWLDNDFYGIVYSANYHHDKINFTLGGGWNIYKGGHYGEIIWVRVAGNTNIRDKYYSDDAEKKDFNFYGKILYDFSEKVTGYLDLQYRQVNYSFLGYNQDLKNVQQSAALHFFNPKIGINYSLNASNNIYGSFSVANREPIRDDYTNSTPQSRPKAEKLNNLEIGWKHVNQNFTFSANYFLMDYKNQLVLTGKINDVGSFTRTNIDKSYRQGIELDGGLKISQNLRLNANFTFSKNKVLNFNEFIDNYDTGGQNLNQYSKTALPFSPDLISSGTLTYSILKNLNISWIAKYVGKQYMDNTSDENRKLNSFFVNNIALNYSIKPKFVKEIAFLVQLNNVFSEKYEPNGYTYSYIYGGQTTTENFYFPQAGFNFLAGMNVKF